jgi:hypothetical protein
MAVVCVTPIEIPTNHANAATNACAGTAPNQPCTTYKKAEAVGQRQGVIRTDPQVSPVSIQQQTMTMNGVLSVYKKHGNTTLKVRLSFWQPKYIKEVAHTSPLGPLNFYYCKRSRRDAWSAMTNSDFQAIFNSFYDSSTVGKCVGIEHIRPFYWFDRLEKSFVSRLPPCYGSFSQQLMQMPSTALHASTRTVFTRVPYALPASRTILPIQFSQHHSTELTLTCQCLPDSCSGGPGFIWAVSRSYFVSPVSMT